MKKLLGEKNLKKGGIAEEIAILKQRREARKAKEEKKNLPQNQKEADIQFSKMMNKKKQEISKQKISEHTYSDNSKIFVVVRKRPLSQKEINNGEIDCVSVINPKMIIHECKVQVDGFTKYLEDHEFFFDNSFSENESTNEIYEYTIAPMINLVLNQGIVTCFAYGQTGSGKTFTMKGIQNLAIDALYNNSNNNQFDFYISFFEIYGGRLYDLLNNKNRLTILDDKYGKVQVYGLINQIAETKEEMHQIINAANSIRTTKNTVTNETSSRSHAICNIVIKLKGEDEEYGKLSLVDLAGSERAQETQSNNRQRRAEGAEINKSLLALKECIRALEEKKNVNPETHVPFRTSNLTHVLRDSFVSKSDKSRIIMISCINPSYCSANHSLNTLRYSDRLKEKTKHHFGGNYNNLNLAARNLGGGNKGKSNSGNNYNSSGSGQLGNFNSNFQQMNSGFNNFNIGNNNNNNYNEDYEDENMNNNNNNNFNQQNSFNQNNQNNNNFNQQNSFNQNNNFNNQNNNNFNNNQNTNFNNNQNNNNFNNNQNNNNFNNNQNNNFNNQNNNNINYNQNNNFNNQNNNFNSQNNNNFNNNQKNNNFNNNQNNNFNNQNNNFNNQNNNNFNYNQNNNNFNNNSQQ